MELETASATSTGPTMESAVTSMPRFCLILGCLPALLFAAAKPTPIQRAAGAPVIDGKLDDACWKNARLIRIVHPHDPKRKLPAKPPMTAQLAWDANYLYLAYEVNDSDIVALGTGRQTGSASNRRPQAVEYAPEKNLDLVEFFIANESRRFFWEIHLNAANHLNTLWIELPPAAQLAQIPKPGYHHIKFHRDRILPDGDPHSLQSAVHLNPKPNGQPSTPNQPNDRDTGYTGELRLPWRGLAPHLKKAPLNGQILSLLVVNLNGLNGKAIYHSSGQALPNLMYHFSVSKWPKFKLVD